MARKGPHPAFDCYPDERQDALALDRSGRAAREAAPGNIQDRTKTEKEGLKESGRAGVRPPIAPLTLLHWRCKVAAQQNTRVAIYARVSTLNHGQDVTMQTRELLEFVTRRGWTVAGEYVDAGISGTKDQRPELDRLMRDAHRRRFDAVVVWKFDRFARSVSHLLRALETFKAQGIDFVSFSEQMDTSTPAGKMVFTVLGAVAELERSLTVERVKAGLRNARAKGKRLGRPRKIVDARRIAALRAQGCGWKKIAKQMGLGVSTVLRASQIAPQCGSKIPPRHIEPSPLVSAAD
jgi:DNA invertase Pin-like site-specific DNA recombinase